MSTPRLRPGDAREILAGIGNPCGNREILAGIGNPCGNRDFHTLRQAQVEALLAEADKLAALPEITSDAAADAAAYAADADIQALMDRVLGA